MRVRFERLDRISFWTARCLVAGVCLLSVNPASAASPGGGSELDQGATNYEPPPTQRRGGFAMGISNGVGIGDYRGYPRTVEALNDPSSRRSTEAAFATNFSVWAGFSLRDWLTTGLGFSALSANGENRGANVGILFHVEAFPLFYMGGIYHDIGLAFDGGLGMAMMGETADKKFEDPIAEGGAMSTLGLSAFWEPLKAWHFSFGPTVNYTHAFSQTMKVDQFTLGIRVSLYGVQPRGDKSVPEATAAHPQSGPQRRTVSQSAWGEQVFRTDSVYSAEGTSSGAPDTVRTAGTLARSETGFGAL